MRGSSSFGAVIRYATNFSLFGAFWLSWFLVTVSQFALNDGNYYEAINAFQNIFGNLKLWKRVYSCLVCAALGALSGYLVNYVITNGFLKVAAFLAVTAPNATLIMAIDHFVLPRFFGISRPLIKIPKWSEASIGNWPAIVALAHLRHLRGLGHRHLPGREPQPLLGPRAAPDLDHRRWAVHRVRLDHEAGRTAYQGAQGAARLLEGGRRYAVTERDVVDIASVAEGKVKPPAPVMAGAAPDDS